MGYTLGAWGKLADADGAMTYTAPVYESGTNACVYWMVIEPAADIKSVKLQRVNMLVVTDGIQKAAKTGLKDTVDKAKKLAERWMAELTT